MEKDRIATLLDKYRRGTITGEEKAFLESWYQQYREADSQGYPAEEMLEDSEAVRAALRETVLPRRNRRRVLYAAAVAAALVFSSLLIIYRNSLWPGSLSGPGTAKLEAIAPGGNKATLTLMGGDPAVHGAAATGVQFPDGASSRAAGGATIELNGDKAGIHSNGKAFQYDDGTAVDSRMPEGFHAQYALLATPRGGQYQVRLPDGSRVWLNAGSSLKYPLTFDGVNQRRVALTGEAYFEVVSDKGKPFVVSTQNQTMEVLGTKFNINSYDSAPQAKTTLLEGALRVTAVSAEGLSDNKKSHLLAPGQQAVMDHGRVRVKQVDPEEAVAWKEGYFQFNNKNLETALAELARWYDVEVVFHNEKMRQQKLAGTISRYARISQVLEKMELTGMISFQVKGRVIIVE